MYRSEAAFSTALCQKLTTLCCPFIQRFESAVTGRGIPDLLLIIDRNDIWVELKNDKKQVLKQSWFKVDWRVGQQTWAYNYYRATKRWTYTVMAVKDGFVIIPMSQRYRQNRVEAHDCYRGTTIADILEAIKIEQTKLKL